VPANSFNDRADYGIGIGIRVPRYRHILVKGRSWIGSRSSRKTSWSMEASARGTDSILYFGSADKLNREHLKKVKRLVKRTNTPWLSDHLCRGSVDGRYAHDLLPDYLNNIPHHRVGNIYIAGHSKFEKYFLDTHDHPVMDPVSKMHGHALGGIGHHIA
jgi:hypothetical protein